MSEQLQLLPTHEWKWRNIALDFVMALPHNAKDNNAIWVIIDYLNEV